MRAKGFLVLTAAIGAWLVAGPSMAGKDATLERKLFDTGNVLGAKLKKGTLPPKVKLTLPKLDPKATQGEGARCYSHATAFLKFLKGKLKPWMVRFAKSVLTKDESARFLGDYARILETVKGKDCSGGLKSNDPGGS